MEVSILHDALKLCWDKVLELVSVVRKKMDITHNTRKFFRYSQKSVWIIDKEKDLLAQITQLITNKHAMFVNATK